MSPDQCREAREVLRWSRRELADAANVALWIVAKFEDGQDVLRHHEIGLRRALERAGIRFPVEIENGQFKPLGVTYGPNGSAETNAWPTTFSPLEEANLEALLRELEDIVHDEVRPRVRSAA